MPLTTALLGKVSTLPLGNVNVHQEPTPMGSPVSLARLDKYGMSLGKNVIVLMANR